MSAATCRTPSGASNSLRTLEKCAQLTLPASPANAANAAQPRKAKHANVSLALVVSRPSPFGASSGHVALWFLKPASASKTLPGCTGLCAAVAMASIFATMSAWSLATSLASSTS